jgi:hypothetical protein
MGKRPSTPTQRASDSKRKVASVRRKYKQNVRRPKTLVPGEEQAVGFTCVVLKLAGYTNTDMSRIVGISKGQVKKLLETPENQAMLVELREKLPSAALELLHGYMIEAVQAIVNVMRASTDDKVVVQAAGEILDRAGLPKTSRQERKSEHEEKLNITDDGLLDKLRDSSPEVQEQAAQLVEALEGLLAEHATGGVSDEETL